MCQYANVQIGINIIVNFNPIMANRLAKEQSPYLLQHAHNPVDWYAWGDEPFERAKLENKPVLVSIGYAACHWCHVMERESFEDEEVAAYMNEHFINIKVDREEHPDVDHLYMDAVQAITGSGGWPLNVFVTPERLPFYGGTYFPPRPAYGRLSWMQLMERMTEVWVNQPGEVDAQTKQMLQYLQQASQVAGKGKAGETWSLESCRQIADNLLRMADKTWGGFGRAPKFPGTMAISFLLEHYHFTKHEDSLKQALLSLDCMIKGGIYDQLGGGFARYSTDEKWLAPHFEKMLYDNALIIVALCDAYSIEKAPHYRAIIEETIAFIERELKEPTGGYYSAIDADSEGVEGKFYTWTWDEWRDIIGEDRLLEQHFGIGKNGNWEHTNILHIAKDIELFATETSFFKDELKQRIIDTKERLFAVREKRVRPLTDDKSLLSWNALMNLVLSKTATVLQDEKYLRRAEVHMQWMLGNFFKDGVLQHSWKQGRARISANLDDYAYLIQALLQLASTSENNEWVLHANSLTDDVLKYFSHEDGVFFYYTSTLQNDIPVRKVDMYDGAMPSANAIMAHNLLLLGMCMERTELTERGYKMLSRMYETTVAYPYSFGYWGILLQRYAKGLKTVIATGTEASLMHSRFRQFFMPHAYILTSKKEISDIPILDLKFSASESLIFVCTIQACLPPERDFESATDLISL
jgi:uncharacterized protein YyaL (SSP411 family)